jgi:RNA polymerase sigma-70 factor (ECF subfamily)
MKYNKSLIMKRAWFIYRKHNHQLSWSDSLKQSWMIEKNHMAELNFNSLYAKYHTQVYYHILSKVNGDKTKAEELTQETFIKVAENLHTYDVDRAKLITWIYTIANHKVIDAYRTNKSDRFVHVDGYQNEDGRDSFEFEAEESNDTETSDTVEAVKRAMSSLNENERAIAEMFFLEQKKYREIADILDVPMGTVKGVLARAKGKLQDKLSNVYATL